MFLRRLASNLARAVYDSFWPPAEKEEPPATEEVGAPLQEHIASGAIDLDFYDRHTRVPGEVPSMGWRADLTKEEWARVNATPWDRVLLIGGPRDDLGPLHHVVQAGDLLVDRQGEPVARVKEGPVPVYLGARAFVTVEWLTNDGAERPASGLDKTRWIGVEQAPWISTHSAPVGEAIGDALVSQIDLDEKCGRIRPEFARALRHSLGYERTADGVVGFDSPACGQFYVDFVVKGRPLEPAYVMPHDGED